MTDAHEVADDEEDQHGTAGRLRVHVDAEFLIAEHRHDRMVVNDTWLENNEPEGEQFTRWNRWTVMKGSKSTREMAMLSFPETTE